MVHIINIKSDVLVKGLTASSDVVVDGNFTVGEPFSFKNSTFNTASTFEKTSTLNQDLIVKGSASLTNVNVEDNMSVGGKLSVKSLEVDGEFSFKNAIFEAPTTFNKSIYANDALNVTGPFSFKSSGNFKRDVVVDGKITASEMNVDVFSFKSAEFTTDTSFKEHVHARKNMKVDGIIQAGALEVDVINITEGLSTGADISTTGNIIGRKGNFHEVNATNLKTESLELTGGLATDGDIYTAGKVSGKEAIFYNVTGIGSTELKSDVTVGGDLEVGGGSEFKGNVVIRGSVVTDKDITVESVVTRDISTSNMVAKSDIDINGAAIFRKNVVIDGDLVVNGLMEGTNTDFMNVNILNVAKSANVNRLNVNTEFTCESVLCQDITQVSDKRLKKEVFELNGRDMMNKIKDIKPSSFKWKHSGVSDIGFMAQEIKTVFPELVAHTDDGVMSVKYANMTAVLMSCIKELQMELETLKKETRTSQV